MDLMVCTAKQLYCASKVSAIVGIFYGVFMMNIKIHFMGV